MAQHQFLRRLWLLRVVSLILAVVALADPSQMLHAWNAVCPECDLELYECRENAGERLESRNRNVCNRSATFEEYQICFEDSQEEYRRRRGQCADRWWFCTECLCDF